MIYVNSSSSKKAKVATLVGYHGMRNFGDDMFLLILSRWLSSDCGACTIYVTARRDRIPGEFSGTKLIGIDPPRVWISRLKWLRIGFRALTSDILCFGAGSIFNRSTPFRLAICVIRLLRMIRGRRLRIIAVGVSLGPWVDCRSSRHCRRLLSFFDMVMLRDGESVRVLSHTDQGPSRIIASHDLALTWRPASESGSIAAVQQSIGVCLNRYAGLFQDETAEGALAVGDIEVLVESLTRFLEMKQDVRLGLFVTCGDERDGDQYVVDHLADRLSKFISRIDRYSYLGEDPENFIDRLGSMHAIISSRMHPGIFSMMLGKPVFQIDYAQKVGEFYRSCGLDEAYLVSPGKFESSDVVDFLTQALHGGLGTQVREAQHQLQQAGRQVRNDLIQCAAAMNS